MPGAGLQPLVTEARAAGVVVRRLSKRFDDAPGGTLALAGVDLDVAPGEFVAVVGPSGAGKSTLLRIVADLTSPSAGEVRVDGGSPREARLAHTYGLVFQAPVLLEWRTVRGNVELPLEVAGVPPADRRRMATEMLRRVGLADALERYPRQLSGGMRHRVALARALVSRPRLLLMDEPFAGLDEPTRERMNLELLQLWHESGVTVLFVTHDIDEAVFLADRVVVLSPRPGRVVANLPVELPRPRDAALAAEPAYFRAVTEARQALRVGMGG
jgi:NitT/TauT family transport system ATP-binding protein